MLQSQKKYLVVVGPTASGKSGLAMELARQLGGEIISCDSVQVYRGFDLGAAKPSAAEQQDIPHHLIDILDWHEDYDAARFARDARATIDDVLTRGRVPVVAGGTGLYLRAMLQQAFHDDMPSDESLRAELRTQTPASLYARLLQLDPKRAAQIHPNDLFRVTRALELNILLGGPVGDRTNQEVFERSDEAFIILLNPERSKLHERIAARTITMLNVGLVQEVQMLLDKGVDPQCKAMQSIGYKQCVDFLAGNIRQEELSEKIIAATRQYAKRQCTWFRKLAADAVIEESSLGMERIAGLLRQSGLNP